MTTTRRKFLELTGKAAAATATVGAVAGTAAAAPAPTSTRVIVLGLRSGTRVLVYEETEDGLVGDHAHHSMITESNPHFAVLLPHHTAFAIRARRAGYKPIEYRGFTMDRAQLTIPLIQLVDCVFYNPAVDDPVVKK